MRYATLAAALSVLLAVAACARSATSSLSLSLSEPAAPADGISRVQATARATGLGPASVVSFELAGPGLLSSTQVRVEDGVAAVEIFAPFEDELTGGGASATLTARAVADPEPVATSVALDFREQKEIPLTLHVHEHNPNRALCSRYEHTSHCESREIIALRPTQGRG